MTQDNIIEAKARLIEALSRVGAAAEIAGAISVRSDTGKQYRRALLTYLQHARQDVHDALQLLRTG